MKALNRKSSITSLPQQNSIGGDSYETNTTRGSMPPEQNGSVNGSLITSSSVGGAGGVKSISSARAKSMSKEPGETSGQTMPSRFFSLSRRLGAKIRFSSSSQPHTKQSSSSTTNGAGLSAKSATNLTEEIKESSSSLLKKSSAKAQSQLLVPSISVEDVGLQQQKQPALKQAESALVVSSSSSSSSNNNNNSATTTAVVSSSSSTAVSDDKKNNLRERALSPSRIFRSLRPRSPFGRSTRSSKVKTSKNK